MREKSVGNIDRYDELQQRRGAKKKKLKAIIQKREGKKKNGSIVPVDRVSIRFLFCYSTKKKEAEG